MSYIYITKSILIHMWIIIYVILFWNNWRVEEIILMGILLDWSFRTFWCILDCIFFLLKCFQIILNPKPIRKTVLIFFYTTQKQNTEANNEQKPIIINKIKKNRGVVAVYLYFYRLQQKIRVSVCHYDVCKLHLYSTF